MAEQIDLGNGTTLTLNDLSGLADLPAVKAAVERRAQAAAALANQLAVTKPDPKDDRPLYYVRSRQGVTGVLPDSYKGVVDDLHHSTLLKVIAADGIQEGP